MNKSVTVTGELETSEQEGGFAADEVTIDERTFSEIICELTGARLNSRGSLGYLNNFGRVRLTIELLDHEPGPTVSDEPG